jgi:nodulation protein F
MSNDLAGAIRNVIVQHLDRVPAELTPESRLDELGVNSLQLTEIIMDLEDLFNIEFTENTSEAWTSLQTVNDVIRTVEAMMAKKT